MINELVPGERVLLPAVVEAVLRVDNKVASVTLYVDGIGRMALNPAQLRTIQTHE